MENEIELKIMLFPENISLIQNWLNQQKIIKQGKDFLGNTYYDSAEQYFAKNKMGLRVRNKNQQYEITLKMKGEIVGGLHIRPEYNLPLPNEKIDFQKLVSHYQLEFSDDILNAELLPVFSTDFERQKWLIECNQSHIEVALDQGLIKNPFGEEPICEIEFELKQGQLTDMFALLDQMPKRDGMWLSSLSKAQRGYWVGRVDEFAKNPCFSAPCLLANYSPKQQYQYLQQLADVLRLTGETPLLAQYNQLSPKPIHTLCELFSAAYLSENLRQLRACLNDK
ncbi:MAG: CYTH domain-containing protein [Pasteurellaceae bacterium]|nr:CYTH domain-containing protein [Pasteurellaceae bacterium]